MAETLTVDPNPPAEIVGQEAGVELTADEQDSLKVGSGLVEEQEKLLAGKYKNAEELERAYGELQKKLGEREQTEAAEAPAEETQESLSPTAQLITSASEEYSNNNGKLSADTIQQLSSMDSKDLVEAYMQLQGESVEPTQTDPGDISDADVNAVKSAAGGEEAYSQLVEWAGNNLDQKSIEAFDEIINSGSVDAIKLAVNGLKSQYENANGYEGRMLTGKPPVNSKDTYRSQAELVRAMNDPRYDSDPAYRQDVIAKLEQSNELMF